MNLLGEILRENEIDHRRIASFRELVPGVNLIRSENALSFGFLGKLEVFTEEEIFKRFKVPKAKFRSVIQHTEPISSKEDLEIGDYVVHYDYGIGRYLGIKTVELQDVRNDYIVLQYANMELYIAVEKITLLEKYQGREESFEAHQHRQGRVGTQEKENPGKTGKHHRRHSRFAGQEGTAAGLQISSRQRISETFRKRFSV